MRAVTLTVIACALTAVLAAQQPAFKRTVLQQGDISVPGREVVSAVAEFEPRATPGRHTHFGEEIGYVLEGAFLVEQDGKPPVTLKAGGTFLVPAGTIHNATHRAPAPAGFSRPTWWKKASRSRRRPSSNAQRSSLNAQDSPSALGVES